VAEEDQKPVTPPVETPVVDPQEEEERRRKAAAGTGAVGEKAKEEPAQFKATDTSDNLYGLARELKSKGINSEDITLFTGRDGKPSLMVSGDSLEKLRELEKKGEISGFGPMASEDAKIAKEQGESFAEIQAKATRPPLPPRPLDIEADEVPVPEGNSLPLRPPPPRPDTEPAVEDTKLKPEVANEAAPKAEAESKPKKRSEQLREERGKAYQGLFGADDDKGEEKEGGFSFGKAAKTVVNVALAPVTLPAAAVAGVVMMGAQAANTAMNGVFSAAAYAEYGASAVVGLGGSAISGLSNIAKLFTSTAEMATAWASEKLEGTDFPGSSALKAAVGAADYVAWGANKATSAGVAVGDGISWAAEKGKEDARQTWENNENATKNLAGARQATIDAQKGIPDVVGGIGSAISGIAGMFSGKGKEQVAEVPATTEKGDTKTVAANAITPVEPDKVKTVDKSADVPKPEAAQEQGEEGRSFMQRAGEFLSTPMGRVVAGVAIVGAAVATGGFIGPLAAAGLAMVGGAVAIDGGMEAKTGESFRAVVGQAVQEIKEQRAEARGEQLETQQEAQAKKARSEERVAAQTEKKGNDLQKLLAGEERPLTRREKSELDREESQQNPVFANILQGNDDTARNMASSGTGDVGSAKLATPLNVGTNARNASMPVADGKSVA
jgi:hypothetical protein